MSTKNELIEELTDIAADIGTSDAKANNKDANVILSIDEDEDIELDSRQGAFFLHSSDTVTSCLCALGIKPGRISIYVEGFSAPDEVIQYLEREFASFEEL